MGKFTSPFGTLTIASSGTASNIISSRLLRHATALYIENDETALTGTVTVQTAAGVAAVAGDMENFSINGTDQVVTALSRDFISAVGGFGCVRLLSSGAEASERTFELYAVMEG